MIAAVQKSRTSTIQTRFGAFETDPGDVITMAEPLPGFPAYKRFVLLASEDIEPFTCLHALDDGGPSFLLVDPKRVVPEYPDTLSEFERHRIGAKGEEPLLWRAIVHITEAGATVNLRAPLVLNPRRMRAIQLIAADSPFSVAQPFEVG